MKTLRQEDGRQLGTTSRKWIYMPTTSYPRAFMRHLICVSYVVLSAHFSNSSPATVPENKEALIFEVFMCGCIQTVEWYLRIYNSPLFNKDPSGPSMHFSPPPPLKKKKKKKSDPCCRLKASEINKLQMHLVSAWCFLRLVYELQ